MAPDVLEPCLYAPRPDQNSAMNAARAMEKTRLGFKQGNQNAHLIGGDREISLVISAGKPIDTTGCMGANLHIDAAGMHVYGNALDIFFSGYRCVEIQHPHCQFLDVPWRACHASVRTPVHHDIEGAFLDNGIGAGRKRPCRIAPDIHFKE